MIYLLSDYLVILLLGDQWTLAIPPLKILAFVALFQSLTSSSFPLLKGLGFPRYETYLTGIMLITSAVIMYPLISKYGINGAAMALLLGQLITFPFFLYLIKKGTNINVSETLKCLLKPILLSIFFVFLTYFIQWVNKFEVDWNTLIQILSSLTLFSISSYFFCLKSIRMMK